MHICISICTCKNNIKHLYACTCMFVCMHYCTHNVMRFFKNILYEHSIRVDKLFKALKVNYFAKLACSICNHIFLLILYMHVTQFATALYKSVLLI